MTNQQYEAPSVNSPYQIELMQFDSHISGMTKKINLNGVEDPDLLGRLYKVKIQFLEYQRNSPSNTIEMKKFNDELQDVRDFYIEARTGTNPHFFEKRELPDQNGSMLTPKEISDLVHNRSSQTKGESIKFI